MDTIIILNAVAWLFIGWLLLVSYASGEPSISFFHKRSKHDE